MGLKARMRPTPMRSAKVAVLGLSVVLLAGCSAVTSAYVAVDGGDNMLTVPAQCHYEITEVLIKYAGDEDADLGFDDLTTVWSAKAEPGHSSKEIVLFQPNVGFSTEHLVTSIDTSEELVIWWKERWDDGDEFEASLIGVVDDLEAEDDVLWFDGVTSVDTYDREVSSPLGRFRC